MCNQLLQMIHINSVALESKQKILHLFLGDLNQIIDFSNGKKYGIYVLNGGDIVNKALIRCRKRIEHIYVHNDYGMYEKNCIKNAMTATEYLRNKGLHFNNSWYIRDYDLIEKYREQMINIVRPYPETQEKINLRINGYRKDTSDILIGVHMRRGDYRTWNNGIFFYSDEKWNNMFQQMVRFPEFKGYHLKFLLFSNEQIQRENFEDKLDIDIVDGTGIEDLFALSMCDFIIGPPSTFSWMANYIGRNKYYVVYDPEKRMQYEYFSSQIRLEYRSSC